MHNASENSSHNLPSHPPDNHHCPDVVYRREWDIFSEQQCIREKITNMFMRVRTSGK